MGRQISYTNIHPLPANIPRQLALDLLHSHEELIRLNQLVTDVKPVPAPANAEAEERDAEWYQVTESVPILPRMKKRIVFKVCFYNQSWGVQSHQIMPGLIEMRDSHRIGGNEPGSGEPPEAREIGITKPKEGLYIREDINVDLHVPFIGPFVKKTTQEALGQMIDRMKRKAELLDEGRLLAMFENGKLKTTKAAAPKVFDTPAGPPARASTIGQPEMMQHTGTFSPIFQSPRDSMQPADIVHDDGTYGMPKDPDDVRAWINRTSTGLGLGITQETNELPSHEVPAQNNSEDGVVGELPGDAPTEESAAENIARQSSQFIGEPPQQSPRPERERPVEVPREISSQPVKVTWV